MARCIIVIKDRDVKVTLEEWDGVTATVLENAFVQVWKKWNEWRAQKLAAMRVQDRKAEELANLLKETESA